MTPQPKTWREALQQLGTLKTSRFNSEVLTELFNVYDYVNYEEFEKRFTKHWIASWICTDTEVGAAFITLDGEPVALSTQWGRKSNEDIDFISPELAKKTHDVFLSLLLTPDPTYPIANLDKEIDDEIWERARNDEQYWAQRRKS